MLHTVGTAQLTGSGTSTVTPCSGGGTLQSQRVGTLFTLVAANCKLLSSDGLVYDGTWTVNLVAFPDVIDGISVTINMTRVRATPGNTSTTLTVALGSGQNLVALTGSNDRQSFQMTDAISAIVALGGTGITAAIDNDRNGTVDVTTLIPWADFL